jgi:hypothetical protein
MLVNADKFSALLHALGLTQGLFKPTPSFLASSGYTAGAINKTDALPQAHNFPVLNGSSNLHALADILKTGNNMNQQDTSCHVDPYDIPIVDVQAFLPFDETKANVFRYRQQQSVNLGSWYASI